MFYFAMILFKLVAFPLSLLPRKLFLALGHGLGALLLRLGFRVAIVRANLELAFPEWSFEKREELLREHYRELGVLGLEMLRWFYRFDRFLERYSRVEGGENLKAALAEGKGVFVMTAHLGNWEVLAASGYEHFGTKVTMVTKELSPAWLHRMVQVIRSLVGVEMACEPRTMPAILRALKKKEIVGFVMDQYAGAPVGARVPFFGKPVGSHTALATLALRGNTPVVPAIAIREPSGRYRLRFEQALPLEQREDPEQAVLANTALFVRHTESWVREFPAQWLWIHRRWKGDLSALPPQAEGEMLR